MNEETRYGKYRNLIIHPCHTLKEAMEINNMSQEELANRTGFSPKHISEVLNGKKGISPSFAKKLEYALPPSTADFWLDYQKMYDLEIETYKEKNNISEEEYKFFDNVKDIYKYSLDNKLMNNVNEKAFQILDFRKLLQISDLNNIYKLTSNAKYRKSDKVNVDFDRLYAWTKVCEKIADNNKIKQKLDIDKLMNSLIKIKNVMFCKEEDIYSKLKNIFGECGINFNIVKSFKGIPVQGFIKEKDNQIYLFVTLRGKYADIFWFTLFHEIGHILNLDYKSFFIDFYDDDCIEEDKANSFARTFLIDDELFNEFINNNKLTIENVKNFSNKIEVCPSIVIGRIMKTKNDYTILAKYRESYEWLI